jgi:uncharacterized protein YgbK (DUF1537 family)
MKALPAGYLVAWYGDDFTGSAATMEVLEFSGIPSVLFLDMPTREQLARFPDARAIGVASTARSHGPDWMDEHLPGPFRFLSETGAPVVHYKVCSTLDSAPHVGSIGKAIDIGAPIVGGNWTPCLVAAPAMRRYQAFGQLFAGLSQGVFRLDRHPVMAQHPVTPMSEADVALHLSRQTQRRFGLVSIEDLESDPQAGLRREIANSAQVICLDACTKGQMEACGDLVWNGSEEQIFCAGSQGVEYALVAYWQREGLLSRQDAAPSAGAVDRMLAVSGSVSPVTSGQIDWAEAHDFEAIALDVVSVVAGDRSVEDAACEAALAALSNGWDPLIFSARGPDDPAVAGMRRIIDQEGIDADVANARIGAALGRILARLLGETGIRRAVISGGDTSGHASRELDIFAFTALAPTTPGAALLQAHSDNAGLTGLQLALKGGQMGSGDYFGWIKRGGGAA